MMYLCASQSGRVVNSVLPAGLGCPGFRGRKTTASLLPLPKPSLELRFQTHVFFYPYRGLLHFGVIVNLPARFYIKICGNRGMNGRESEISRYLILLLALHLKRIDSLEEP